jgi:SAM-dependent methyltransferase
VDAAVDAGAGQPVGSVQPARRSPATAPPPVRLPAAFADEASASAAASHFDPAFGRRFAERALDALVVVRGARVVEVACGTGIFARLAARVTGPGGRVVALDAAGPALAVAERVDITGMVAWGSWDGGRLPHPDASFDVAGCQHGLQRFDDPVPVLEEMARVLVPGGRLGVMTWGPIEENPAFAAQLDAAIKSGLDGSGVVDTLLRACSLHRVDQLLALARDAGLHDVSCRTVRMLATLPPVADWVRLYPSLPPLADAWQHCDQQTRIQFLSRAAELLRPFEHDGVLRVQASSRLLVARAPLG